MIILVVLIIVAILWLISGLWFLITKTPVHPVPYLLAIISWIIAMLPDIIRGFQ